MSGIEDMGPINELRMVARWKLGRALAATERGGQGGRPGPMRSGADAFAARAAGRTPVPSSAHPGGLATPANRENKLSARC